MPLRASEGKALDSTRVQVGAVVMAMPSGFAVIQCSTAAAAQKVFPEEWHALLLNEIVGERQGGMKILSAMRCTILGKIGYSFEREVCIGDQFSQAD